MLLFAAAVGFVVWVLIRPRQPVERVVFELRDDPPAAAPATSPIKSKVRADGAVWVEGYTRSDGAQVRGHWRAAPERK